MTLLRKVLIAEFVWFLLAMFIAGFDPSWITRDQFGPLRTLFVGIGAVIGGGIYASHNSFNPY